MDERFVRGGPGKRDAAVKSEVQVCLYAAAAVAAGGAGGGAGGGGVGGARGRYHADNSKQARMIPWVKKSNKTTRNHISSL